MFFNRKFYLLIFLFILGCRAERPAPLTAVRLVTLQKSSSSAPSATTSVVIPKTEFRFNNGLAGWESVDGVAGLEVRNGMLTGRTTGNNPILHLERKTSNENADTIHSIELKLRVSAGANFWIGFIGAEKFDREEAKANVRDFKALMESTPVIAGSNVQSYTLKPRFAYPSSDIRHIIVVPTDQSGAEFQIESIRLIFRKEYLATIPSGVSWQGLKGIYHETIVSRSPEVIRLELRMPKSPWLDLNIGTIEDGPVTFQVSLAQKKGTTKTIFEHTITRPHVWQPFSIPLSGIGRKATLALTISTEKPGMIGFWGSPVIRTRHRTQADATTKAPQGVIVIWADTLRKDHLDVYGYNRATAPNIKRIAEEGVLFKNCISQATWTKVASPTLFTGLYPTAHGVIDFADRLPSSAETLPEIFQKAGYATIGFSSNLFTATYSNFHQGFEQLHEDSSLPNPNFSKTSRDYMDRLLPWLDMHRNVPYFVFLHVYDPHEPYEPYPPYNSIWSEPGKKAQHEQDLENARKIIKDPLLRAFGAPDRREMIEAKIDPEEFVSYAKGWYDGSIRGMDTEIGRLMQFLRNNNLKEKTLVVFVGDHGEEFLEHERMSHGQTVYGELTNVPLILWRPGTLGAGLTIEDPVETVDVMPTILELSGLKTSQSVQGQSLAALLQKSFGNGAKAKTVSGTWNRPAFSMKAVTSNNASPPPQEDESFAVVLNDWKLIHNTKRTGTVPEFELFHETSDPLNKKNVAEANPEIVKKLSKLIDEWRKKSAANALKRDADAAKSLSQEELERLRSLGYIQ